MSRQLRDNGVEARMLFVPRILKMFIMATTSSPADLAGAQEVEAQWAFGDVEVCNQRDTIQNVSEPQRETVAQQPYFSSRHPCAPSIFQPYCPIVPQR